MSRLRDKVPVEPLTPDRVARVEHAVLAAYRATEPAPARRRRGLARVALPLAAACAVAALVWFARGSQPAADDVAVAPATPTHVVSTDTGSTLDLGGATVRLGPDTEIDIRRDDGGIQIALARGTVDCEVEPRQSRPPFVVEAGKVDVVVVGTVFEVVRDGDDVRVSVTRGKVRVDAAGASAYVAAGERWSEGVVTAAAVESDGPGSGGLAVAAVEPGAGVAADRPVPNPTARKKSRAGADSSRARPRSRPRKPASTASSSTGFAGERPPSIGKPTAAPGSATRESLYAKAWHRYFSDRDVAEALAELHYFERRFDKKGARTEDVLKLRIRIQCTKASSGCRKAAYRYLELYPNGDYRDQARALTNWM